MPNAHLATLAIVDRCHQTRDLGIAVSTAILAVGAINPFARGGNASVPTRRLA